MGRNRVLSFVSPFSTGAKTSTPTSSPPATSPITSEPVRHDSSTSTESDLVPRSPLTPPPFNTEYGTAVNDSPASATSTRHRRSDSRPRSMVSAHQPPLMEINEDTIPELLPIFSFLNSHANKLYQEGYFLKLDDQNTQGRPNQERTWTECFAQLVGTTLSLWDAAELDAAGEDGEVMPKFINLTDASIKMINSLPTRSNDEQPLQNILSISTAGRNRYLLHFNSHHSLVQWTAGIRLAMFEHSTLQEAYTGALIAGKGKSLNSINLIMEKSRFKTEEWVRVRFGAGVPWRRCWCVVTPPDEKELAKQAKEMKKKSPYDRSHAPALTGNIHFYDTRKDGKKQKKAQPIATITQAYSAYAIYPQAKSLIDASTLIKLEGDITIHSEPSSSIEGFVFIMPETRPAVSGFETMLRFLFPTWDTFNLYGRPGRLVASTLDPRSLMFAMPKHRRYGYLEIIDVASLLVDDNSSSWKEKEWRRRLKEVTGARMNAMDDDDERTHSRSNSRQSGRLSFGQGNSPSGKARVGFSDGRGSVRSSRSMSLNGGTRNDTTSPDAQGKYANTAMAGVQMGHARNSSDPVAVNSMQQSRQGYSANNSPLGQQMPMRDHLQGKLGPSGRYSPVDRDGSSPTPPPHDFEGMRKMETPEPVSRPPAFSHKGQGRPASKPYHSPQLRQATSRLSSGTLAQMAKAVGLGYSRDSQAKHAPGRIDMETGVGSGPSVLPHAASYGSSANDNRFGEVVNSPNQSAPVGGLAVPPEGARQRSRSPQGLPPQGPGPNSQMRNPQDGRRSPYPGSPSNTGQGPSPSPSYRSDPNRGPQDGRQAMAPSGAPPNMYGQAPNMSPGGGPFPGQQGSSGQPMQAQIRRMPVPERGMAHQNQGSSTDDILDHYSNSPGPSPPPHRRPLPAGHQATSLNTQMNAYEDQSSNSALDMGAGANPNTVPERMERPRAGVMRTVGESESGMPPNPQYDLPNVNFGPTVNYGAPSQLQQGRGPGPSVPGHAQRPYSPSGHANYAAGDTRGDVPQYPPGRPSPGQNPSEKDLRARRRSSFDMVSPERGLATPTDARNRPSSSGEMVDSWEQERQRTRPDPNNPGYSYGMGQQQPPRGMPPAMGQGNAAYGASPPSGPYGQGQGQGFPIRTGAQPPRPIDPRLAPPQGPYTIAPQSPRNMHPQYQGQAF